jgi:alpha-beta hydrolase superfamily lysophospholipase
MKSERITFVNHRGARLGARIDFPEETEASHFALFAHCFTCTKNLKTIGNINEALTGQGIAVLRFDFTGLGESEGDFAETNFTTNVDDLRAASEFLETEYRGPRILIGHSLGGAAVLQAASSIPSSVAVATIAAPSEPSHINKLLGENVKRIIEEGEAQISIAGKSFIIKKQFVQDLEQTRMEEKIQNLNKALVVFHSPADSVVGIDNAAHIFQNARHPKSFISLDKADHLLLDKNDAEYVGNLIGIWAKRYLEKW